MPKKDIDFEDFWEYLLERARDHDAWWLDDWLEDELENYKEAPKCPKCGSKDLFFDKKYHEGACVGEYAKCGKCSHYWLHDTSCRTTEEDIDKRIERLKGEMRGSGQTMKAAKKTKKNLKKIIEQGEKLHATDVKPKPKKRMTFPKKPSDEEFYKLER